MSPLSASEGLVSIAADLYTYINIIINSIIDICSNGNASETKANESFDNGVFFAIEAKRTASTIS